MSLRCAAPSAHTSLSLHDALPISEKREHCRGRRVIGCRIDVIGLNGYRPRTNNRKGVELDQYVSADRKSTRLNSSHRCISYAVFCLKENTGRLGTCPCATCSGTSG